MLLWPFNKYPGTDYETFNWEWILKTVKEWVATMQTFKNDITAAWNAMRADWLEFETSLTDEWQEFIDDTYKDQITEILEDHPEWVTTVMDGAITKPKINSAFLKEIENAYNTPDNFDVTGTDADLLEYAINNTPEGGVLFLNRTYTLDRNIVINKNSATKRITIFGSENAVIDCQSYHFSGTIAGNTGNIKWFNIDFRGDEKLFDGYYLIRLYFQNCHFYSMKSIMFNSNSSTADSYMQSIYFDCCDIRQIDEYIIDSGPVSNRSQLMDIQFTHCLIEWCHSGIMNARGYSEVVVDKNCIEGFTTNDKLIANCREGSGLIFTNNYCESNHVTYVDFSGMTVQNPFTFIFEGNSIYEHVNKTFGIIVTGSKNDGTGNSIYNVANNTFATLAQYGSQIYMIDASNATEDLVNWCVWNNHRYNNYMTEKNDPNNRITIHKNLNTALGSYLQNTYGVTPMKSGDSITIRAFVAGIGLNTHILAMPITFPFKLPSGSSYTAEFTNIQVVGVSGLDTTKIAISGTAFDTGCEVRYTDNDNAVFTTDRAYSVRLTMKITIS